MEKRESEPQEVYQPGSLWEHLEKHGYDEHYFRDHHLSVHRQRKRKAIGIALIAFIAIAATLAFFMLGGTSLITGHATIDLKEGCCVDLCAQTLASECTPDAFRSSQSCKQIPHCQLGCCIDTEGYCLTNYLQGNCNAKQGNFQTKKCKDIIYCKFGTDKPLVARDEELRQRRLLNFSTGISEGVAYYGSYMVIRHVVSPLEGVVSVSAILRKNGIHVATVPLFDDGSHSDGGLKDGIFAQVWDSGSVPLSSSDPTVVKLAMDVEIIRPFGVEMLEHTQTLTLLDENTCFPLTYPPRTDSKNLVIMGEGYSDYAEYKQDASNFLGRLFSSGNLSLHVPKTNLYRIDTWAPQHMAPALELAKEQCPSFSDGRDTLVILRRGFVCEENDAGLPVVKVEPRTFLNSSISNMSFGTFGDFCNYVKTEQQIVDEVAENIKGPRAVFVDGNSSIVNSTTANITFSIEYVYWPVTYDVYVDSIVDPETFQPLVVASGSTMGTSPIYLETPNLGFGEHTVSVNAKWKRWSQRWSTHLLNVTVGQNEEPLISSG